MWLNSAVRLVSAGRWDRVQGGCVRTGKLGLELWSHEREFDLFQGIEDVMWQDCLLVCQQSPLICSAERVCQRYDAQSRLQRRVYPRIGQMADEHTRALSHSEDGISLNLGVGRQHTLC